MSVCTQRAERAGDSTILQSGGGAQSQVCGNNVAQRDIASEVQNKAGKGPSDGWLFFLLEIALPLFDLYLAACRRTVVLDSVGRRKPVDTAAYKIVEVFTHHHHMQTCAGTRWGINLPSRIRL